MPRDTELSSRRATSARNQKELEEINEVRALVGLKPLDLKDRKCLKCGKMFMTSKSTRICCDKESNAGILPGFEDF